MREPFPPPPLPLITEAFNKEYLIVEKPSKSKFFYYYFI